MNTKNAKKANAKETKETPNIKLLEFNCEKVRVVEGKNGDVVFFTLMLNGVYIYNCRVSTGRNGDFISFPQVKGKDDKYYNTVYVKLSDEDEQQILDCVQDIIDHQ